MTLADKTAPVTVTQALERQFPELRTGKVAP